MFLGDHNVPFSWAAIGVVTKCSGPLDAMQSKVSPKLQSVQKLPFLQRVWNFLTLNNKELSPKLSTCDSITKTTASNKLSIYFIFGDRWWICRNYLMNKLVDNMMVRKEMAAINNGRCLLSRQMRMTNVLLGSVDTVVAVLDDLFNMEIFVT